MDALNHAWFLRLDPCHDIQKMLQSHYYEMFHPDLFHHWQVMAVLQRCYYVMWYTVGLSGLAVVYI